MKTSSPAKKSKSHDRAEDETTLTFNLPISMKEDLKQRAELTGETPISRLIRLAIRYHDLHGWKDIAQVYQGALPKRA